MIRVPAFCRRWFKYKRLKPGKNCILTAEEILSAETHLILLDQQFYFKTEIDYLRKNKQILKKSRISSFNPFLDEKGILRVGGRLSECPFLIL